jgi:hypothetical protein
MTLHSIKDKNYIRSNVNKNPTYIGLPTSPRPIEIVFYFSESTSFSLPFTETIDPLINLKSLFHKNFPYETPFYKR